MKSGLNEKWLVCRICLKQPKEEMQTIFDKNVEKDLTRMILECGGVPVIIIFKLTIISFCIITY